MCNRNSYFCRICDHPYALGKINYCPEANDRATLEASNPSAGPLNKPNDDSDGATLLAPDMIPYQLPVRKQRVQIECTGEKMLFIRKNVECGRCATRFDRLRYVGGGEGTAEATPFPTAVETGSQATPVTPRRNSRIPLRAGSVSTPATATEASGSTKTPGTVKRGGGAGRGRGK